MKKEYIIEFGVRRGAYAENIIPGLKAAKSMAASLVHVFATQPGQFPTRVKGNIAGDWDITPAFPRQVWVSRTHFVALSLLDGVMRGPASARYWRRTEEEEGMEPRMERYAKYQSLFDQP